MGLPHMPISWGGSRGQLIGIYGSPMECLGVVGHGRTLQDKVGRSVLWGLFCSTCDGTFRRREAAVRGRVVHIVSSSLTHIGYMR